MKDVKLDLSKFKHVKTDGFQTTLKHKDGHTISLAHHALSEATQKQLQALGGSAKAAQTPLQADEAHDQTKMAEGGEVKPKKHKLMGSAGSKDQLSALATKHFYSPIRIQEHPSGEHEVHNSKGKIEGLRATEKKGRWRLEREEPEDSGEKMAKGGEVKNSPKAENKGHKFEVRPAHNGAGHQLQHTNPKGDINTYHGFKDPKEAHAMAKSIAGEEEYAKGGKVEPKPKAQPQEPQQKPAVKKHEDPRYGSTTVIDNEDKRNGTVRQKFAKGDLVEENPELQRDSVDDAQAALDDGIPRESQEDYTQDPYNAVDAITTRLPSSPNIDANAKPQYQLAANDMAQDGLSPKRDAVADRPDMPQGAPQLASAEMPSQGGVRAPAATPSEEVGLTQDSQQPSQGLAQPAQSAGMPDMGGLINQGYSAAQRGAELRAGAEHSLGTETAGIQGDAAAASQKAKDTFKQSYDETLQELHNHMQDVKEGQIDPDKYWAGDKDGNGSHSRVMAGIGMILAGFNPTSNPNAAINYIQHQIDKSVEAQSKNLESKQNLVRANLEQFHNLKDATEMARLQQADVVNHYMDQAMAKAKTPFAQAALQEAKSTIAQQYAPLAMQLSIRQAVSKIANGLDNSNPDAVAPLIAQLHAMPGGSEQAKTLSEAYVPGVGVTKSLSPVPGAVREQITSQQKLQSAAQDLLSYSRGHTNIVPGTAAYNTGVQKAAIVQQMVREGMLGTVFRESEKPLLNQFVNHNPAGAFKAMSTDPKLRTLIESNEAQLNTLKSNYGLPTSHGAADASKSGPVKGKDGKMYQLDPSGKYYIPVGK